MRSWGNNQVMVLLQRILGEAGEATNAEVVEQVNIEVSEEYAAEVEVVNDGDGEGNGDSDLEGDHMVQDVAGVVVDTEQTVVPEGAL